MTRTQPAPLEATSLTAPMLKVSGLNFFYGESHILRNVDMTVPKGQMVCLIGRTGVGKTTTVAKLAATFKLKQNKKVGLITADTYRIAAVEQLRTYAEIINVPLKVALSPTELPNAIASFQDQDLVLVDTAGRSQHDADRLAELKALVDVARPDQTHLVLSAAASPGVLKRACERFAMLKPDRLLFTKLDEAVGLGPLLDVIDQMNLPLGFVSTGQEVPAHIEPADALRIAERILGRNHSAASASPLQVSSGVSTPTSEERFPDVQVRTRVPVGRAP